MQLSVAVELDYWMEAASDVLLQIEVAALPDQHLDHQSLVVWSDHPIVAVPGHAGIGQRCVARADGQFRVAYEALVTIARTPADLSSLPATPLGGLPGDVIEYLLPSRYVEGDQFEGFVSTQFSSLSGGALAQALVDWTGRNLVYRAGASNGTTTALTTFANRSGVCRDYAHLLAALARAGGIPARCVAAYAPGVDPPDFHAVCQLWLAGEWHLVDATGMARARDLAIVAVGRDATDIAFMTVFGAATLWRQAVRVAIA
ncbi:MAG: transglutaminase-like domain-containing protein [Sphingomonas sp.]